MLISHEVQLTAVKKYIFNVIVFNCHWLMQSQSGAKIFSQKCWVLIKKKKKKEKAANTSTRQSCTQQRHRNQHRGHQEQA